MSNAWGWRLRPRAAESAPSGPASSRWHSDLAWVLVAAAACYGLSVSLDLHEMLGGWMARYEHWEVDELPLSAGVLALGLAWYALRRRGELQAELERRELAEARAAELLLHNQELSRRLISLQESERLALARELHDEVGQHCSALLLETAGLRRAARGNAAALLPGAARAHMAAQGVYQLVGDLLRRLRPAHLDTLGLLAALQELCEGWEERSGIACVFHHDGPVQAPCEVLDITVYRIVQESLTNVARHAGASRVQVRLTRGGPQSLVLVVEDDGCGMDTRAATRGLGLLGAAERAAAAGGRLEVHSQPGAGVRLVAHLPWPAAGQAGQAATEPGSRQEAA
jgi:signal transduction histidine kinase